MRTQVTMCLCVQNQTPSRTFLMTKRPRWSKRGSSRGSFTLTSMANAVSATQTCQSDYTKGCLLMSVAQDCNTGGRRALFKEALTLKVTQVFYRWGCYDLLLVTQKITPNIFHLIKIKIITHQQVSVSIYSP